MRDMDTCTCSSSPDGRHHAALAFADGWLGSGDAPDRLKVALFIVCRFCERRAAVLLNVDEAQLVPVKSWEPPERCEASSDRRHHPVGLNARLQCWEDDDEATIDLDVRCQACGRHGSTTAGAMMAKVHWD